MKKNLNLSYLMPKTKIKKSDLLIIFGTTYGIDLFVKDILFLYNKKYCKYILCTGGKEFIYNNKTCIEGSLMKEILIKKIPEEFILEENKSQNSGENLQFSIPILKQTFGKIENIKSIIGLGKNFATLRFLMTMCKYFPNSEKMFYPVNVFNVNMNNYLNNKNILKKLILEDTKINEYLKKGYITNIDEKVLFLNKKHNKFIQKSLKLNFHNK